ncbi:hypothetical protein [Planktotalea sp.]|uniref:hypothetical protein n=1 Tax=Planktotalea sp. TaxID=2029877 RepID=UPI003D6C07E6
MKKLGLACMLALFGSSVAAHEYHRWSGPLPALVEQNLPADIPASDVLVKDGCFFYLYEGQVFQLLNGNSGAAGLPICIG